MVHVEYFLAYHCGTLSTVMILVSGIRNPLIVRAKRADWQRHSLVGGLTVWFDRL